MALRGLPNRAYGDLARVDDFRPILEGHDVVVHVAAAAHGRYASNGHSAANVFEQDADVVKRLAEACCSLGVVHLIFISSIAVYPLPPAGACVDETTSPSPATPYGLGKIRAERELLQVCQGTSTRWTIVRPAMVYGANAPGNFNKLLRAVRVGAPLPLGAITNRRSLLSIDHLADLMLLMVNHQVAFDQLFVASDANPISSSALVESIAAGLGLGNRAWPAPKALLRFAGRLTGTSTMVSSLVDDFVVDPRKATGALGWCAASDTASEVRRYVTATRTDRYAAS